MTRRNFFSMFAAVAAAPFAVFATGRKWVTGYAPGQHFRYVAWYYRWETHVCHYYEIKRAKRKHHNI